MWWFQYRMILDLDLVLSARTSASNPKKKEKQKDFPPLFSTMTDNISAISSFISLWTWIHALCACVLMSPPNSSFYLNVSPKENQFHQQPQRQEPPPEEHELSSLSAEWVFNYSWGRLINNMRRMLAASRDDTSRRVRPSRSDPTGITSTDHVFDFIFYFFFAGLR